MLLEGTDRELPLDGIETQYYRAVLNDERLSKHIERSDGIRFSAGCRDVAATLAQDDVALASGLLARQLRSQGEEAIAAIWQCRPGGDVGRIDIPLHPIARYDCDGWGFLLDAGVIERASRYRAAQLPTETGGVMIGYFDVPRRCVYVVDVLPAPPDSVEHKTAFIRGFAGLRESLDVIAKRTGQQVGYVGEWHSHPIGASVAMSGDDQILLTTVAEEVRMDGWPGVMMIVGDEGQIAFYTLQLDGPMQ